MGEYDGISIYDGISNFDDKKQVPTQGLRKLKFSAEKKPLSVLAQGPLIRQFLVEPKVNPAYRETWISRKRGFVKEISLYLVEPNPNQFYSGH